MHYCNLPRKLVIEFDGLFKFFLSISFFFVLFTKITSSNFDNISVFCSPDKSITSPKDFLPFCLSPKLITGIPTSGASIRPLEELPIKQLKLFNAWTYKS